MTTTRFLALCATAILVIASTVAGCGGDNGSGETEDVFVGTDNGTDTTDIGGDFAGCIPSYYIMSSDGICIPPTDTSDDSTAIETEEEVANDPCEIYYPLEGSTWICHAAYDFTCTLQVDVVDTWCRIRCPEAISQPANKFTFIPPLPSTPTSLTTPPDTGAFNCDRQGE